MAQIAPPPGFQLVQSQGQMPPLPPGFQMVREQERPDLSASETAVDVAKSAGIGLAQGGIGLATLPGNIEMLGRMGIDAAARGLGYNDPQLSKDTLLPNFNDAKTAIEGYTGEFYTPKSTAGEYARTIGEFAPLAAFGGGLSAGARALNVVAPAVASETAGQLTEGTAYEPWARAAGALAGGQLPTAAMKAVTPVARDATRAAQVATLQREGVKDLTAGQITGSKPLRWAESVTQDTPLAGGRAARMMDSQAEQFTRATLRRAGVNADRATPDVIDGAYTGLGQQFDDLAARNVLKTDRGLIKELKAAWDDYSYITPESQRAPVVQKILTDIWAPLTTQGSLPGPAYQALRSQLEKMSRSTRMSNPELSQALGNIRGALDDAMGRSVSPKDAAQWKQIRGQYKNLVAIEKAATGAGENAALGLISPSALRNAVKQQNQRSYARGKGDLSELARAGEAIMKPLPQSGTAPRAAAMNSLNLLSGLVGHGAAGIPGAVAGLAVPGMAGRTLMSRPVQNYLTNQTMAAPIAAYEANRLNALLRAPQAAQQAIEHQPLRGGIGPMYDEYGNPL